MNFADFSILVVPTYTLVRLHGISSNGFIAYLLNLHIKFTVTFGSLLSFSISTNYYALYSDSVRQTMILLLLLS